MGKKRLYSGKPEMNVFTINENPEVKRECVGTIAMCTRDSIKAQTAISMMMTDLTFLEPHQYVKRFMVQGHVLVAQRNECILRMEGDWILFIDDDMVWQPSAIREIVETQRKWDLDMVGGLCFQRGGFHQPTMFYQHPEGRGYTWPDKWPEDAAIEVDATGMAFVLIHKRVFERILNHELPSFDERLHLPPPGFFKWGDFGEDLAFCRDAKITGSKIFVDTSIKIGHIGETVFTEQDYFQGLLSRTPEFTSARKYILDSIGKELMTREEALEKLGWA